MMPNFEVGEIVPCIVDRIVGTIVFVKINSQGKETEGSIIMSEIAPGRIRNLRDYIVPKKKIICKILRISPRGGIDLSLRRVSPKEKKEILDQQKLEKSYENIIKNIIGEDFKKILKEIKKETSLYDFIQESKENAKNLQKIVGKEYSDKIIEMITSQKSKKAILKKEIYLSTSKENGLELIKNTLLEISTAEIKYLSPGKYSLKIEGDSLKSADNSFKEISEKIEKISKEKGLNFSIKEK